MIKSEIRWIRCKFGTPLQFCTLLRRAYQKHTIAFVTGDAIIRWTEAKKWEKWEIMWAPMNPYGSPEGFNAFIESISYD